MQSEIRPSNPTKISETAPCTLHFLHLMGIGHSKSHKYRQESFSFAKTKSAHRFCHGGVLRKQRAGRGQRPLSSKESLHLVLKVRREKLRSESLRTPANFQLIHEIIRRYSQKFFVQIEQISIQGDHLHVLIRTKRRSHFHHFFRVTAGQIAQRFQNEGRLKNQVTGTSSTAAKAAANRKYASSQTKVKGTKLWKYRPYSRFVRGRKAYQTVRNYIQLNEQEAKGKIKYNKDRLKGLSNSEWEILWS